MSLLNSSIRGKILSILKHFWEISLPFSDSEALSWGLVQGWERASPVGEGQLAESSQGKLELGIGIEINKFPGWGNHCEGC